LVKKVGENKKFVPMYKEAAEEASAEVEAAQETPVIIEEKAEAVAEEVAVTTQDEVKVSEEPAIVTTEDKILAEEEKKEEVA